MTDNFLFGIFPYVAFSLAILGGVYRYLAIRFSYSSLSSQFLENRVLFWSSVPWHYGIVLILLAHLFGTLFREASVSLLSEPARLFILELIGLSLGFFAFFGIVFFTLRRISDAKVRTVTSATDWILLVVLIMQVAAGISIALFHRWGSLWYLDTAVPWFWSMGRFSPDHSAINPLPWIVKFHMFNAFILILLFPFTRLVHIFSVPITYLWRPYQVVIWNRVLGHGVSVSGGPGGTSALQPETGRRDFLKLVTGLMSALVAVALGIPLIGSMIGSSFRTRKPLWAKVGAIDSLPMNEPVNMKFPFEMEDAYIRETVIQDVWVIKHSSSEVIVFSPICPHLGCHYNWYPETKEFACPCHGSIFSITGGVIGGPAPRSLDTLPTKLEKGELLVELERFKVGISEKVPV